MYELAMCMARRSVSGVLYPGTVQVVFLLNIRETLLDECPSSYM